MPVHQFVHDHLLAQGPDATTGATTRSASSRRTTSTPAARAGAARWPSSRPWSRPARGRHRGDPRRGLQPHRRGQPPRAHAVLPRASTTRPTTASPTTRQRALHRLHRHRQQPEHAAPPRAAADHGLAALLGDRDARRRLPLRPGRHPGPRAPRGRPAVGVLRPHPAGPGHQPGEAHRRALGRGRGRLPGRQLPAAVVGVERQVPRHRARLLARRRAHPRRVRLRFTGSSDLYATGGRKPPSPASTSSPPRRLHAARPGVLQRQAQRGQRRGQPRRREPQPLLELRRRGPDRRPGHPRAAPAPAAQLPHHAASSPRACPCCWHGDEIGRTQQGNNNAYCQDNELSWVDWGTCAST
jgi:hypothetical protein